MTVSGAGRSLDERFHTLQTMTSPLTLLVGGYRCLEAISTTCLDGRVAHGRFFVLACRPITNTKPRVRDDPTDPSFGEELPIVGLGIAVSFPSADESQRAALKEVIDALVAGGGKQIDTASVYGNAESVIGDIVRASNVPVLLIFATPSKQPQFRERRSRSARSDLGRAGLHAAGRHGAG